MTLVAIRDDDTSFFTKPEELLEAYQSLWARKIPVSLAVIPFSVQFFQCGGFDRLYQALEEKPLHENTTLVDFLKDRIGSGNIHIMLHGINHLHKFRAAGSSKLLPATQENLQYYRTNNIPIKWFGEFCWKKYHHLREEIAKEGKAIPAARAGCTDQRICTTQQ